MGYRRRHRAEYSVAPGTGLKKVVPEVRLPPGDGDEKREALAREAAEKNVYVQKYRAAGGADEQVALVREAIAAENELRKTFAQDRASEAIADPYVTLIPMHGCMDIFGSRGLSAEEEGTPKVFSLASRRKGPATVTKGEFKENFNVFTEGLLQGLNWDNVFLAGGAVLATVLPVPEKYGATRQGKRQYYHHDAYTASDIDLFFYGLDEAQANEKLKEVYFAICDTFPDPSVQPLCFRTRHAVTIVSKFPYRHVQVILRIYKSPAEVLAGFDVDSCSIGFDGANVWMTPRCHSSIVAKYNTVDMTRRSPTYEVRLAKYASRGMEVLVPVLDRQHVDPQIYEIPFEKTNGLAKLLLLEKLNTPEQRLQYKHQQRLGRLQPLMVRQGPFYNRLQADMADAFLREQIDSSVGDVSDYQTVFLPWGPSWDADKVRNLVFTKDMLLNSTFVDPFHKGYRHPCFFGSAEEILQDCSGSSAGGGQVAEDDGEKEDADKDDQDSYVRGPLKWLTVDPGQQSIGSFHPITDGEWAAGVHISSATEKLVQISQDLSLSKEAAVEAVAAIRPPVDANVISARDAVGRTPLMLAVLMDNAAAAHAFIHHGALLNSRLGDGRTALHLAAQYGKVAVLAPLIESGEVLNAALKSHLEQIEQDERAIAEGQISEDEKLKQIREEQGSGEYYRALYVLKKKRAREAARRSATREERGYLDKLDLDGPDYDQKMTPLMYAVFFGHLGAVSRLLDARADVEKMLAYEQNGVVAAKHALLTLACHNGSVEVFGLLLEHKALGGQVDLNQRSPLHYAAQWGEIDCVRLLVDRCSPTGDKQDAAKAANAGIASSDAIDQEQKTPLLHAIEQGHVSVVEFLLKHTGKMGALASQAPQPQHSPVAFAVQVRKDSGVLELLLRLKGDVNTRMNQGGQGGGGLFGGHAGGLFGARHLHQRGGAAAQTVLDFVEAQITQLEAQAKSQRADPAGPASGSTAPHVTRAEYFDFLLSKTPTGYQRFALCELKARAQAADEAQGAQRDGGVSSVHRDQTALDTLAAFQAKLKVLTQYGAKSARDLEEESNAQAPPGSRRKAKPQKRQNRRAASGPPASGSTAAAFELGVVGGAPANPSQGGAFGRPGQTGLFGAPQGGLFGAPQGGLFGNQGGAFGNRAARVPEVVSLSYTEHFEPIRTPTEGVFSLDVKMREPQMQPMYTALFDAVVAGDCPKVSELCRPPTGESSGEDGGGAGPGPLLVSVRSTLLQMTLLDVAVAGNSADMVRCILRLAKQQHTPELPVDDTALDSEATEDVNIKDAHLIQMGAQDKTFTELLQSGQPELQQLQQTHAYKKKGHKMLDRLERYKAEQKDGGAEDAPLLSVCSVHHAVTGGTGGDSLQRGVQRQAYDAVEALLSELDALDVLVDPDERPQEQAGFAKPFGGPAPHLSSQAPPSVKSLLLRKRSNYNGHRWEPHSVFTPFEAAVANDDVRMAELLLGRGAQDCLRDDEDKLLPEAYTGLEVAGEKREDWALPRKLVISRAAVRERRLRALHVAAGAGAEASIEFLLDGGLDTYAIVGDPGDAVAPEGDGGGGGLVTSSLFSLEDHDANGQTSLHHALQRGQASALRRLLAVGRGHLTQHRFQRLLDACRQQGDGKRAQRHQLPERPPLHLAVSLTKHACVVALLEHKASMSAPDSQGETPLHIAATLAESTAAQRAAKSEMLTTLLGAAQASDTLLAALTRRDGAGATALHRAAKYQAKLALASLLGGLRTLGSDAQRSALDARTPEGHTALHIAAQHTSPKSGGLFAERPQSPEQLHIVRELLAVRADTGLVAANGALPLHLAAKAGATSAVLELLVPQGRAAGKEDATGRTPLEWYTASIVAHLSNRVINKDAGSNASLELLAKAESNKREVVDPGFVLQHTARMAELATGKPKGGEEAREEGGDDEEEGSEEEEEEEGSEDE